MEKVSIITPSYNCGSYISDTIESVLAQTHTNWEMVIVDDCSTDDTCEVVAEYAAADSRIIYHKLEQNSGAAVARTKAMELADGDFMAFLDSDDLWTPEKLELQLKFMRDNGYSMTATAYRKINENGDDMMKTITPPLTTDYNRLLLDCPVGNSTIMYSVRNMGKFSVPNILKRNDDALWLKMLKTEKYIYGMPDVMMSYRVRSNSISSNRLALVKYHWILYRDIERLSVVRSVYLICRWGFVKILGLK